jgi:hypothetical protein
MFKKDWGELNYKEQIGYLSNLVHVVASEMEKRYGAISSGEIFGAAVSIIEEIPNISKFYKNRPELLKEQMGKSMKHLEECGQISKHECEFVCVSPQIPHIESFVRDVFENNLEKLKRLSTTMYTGMVQKEYYILPNPIGLDFGQTRFNR